MRGHHGLSGKPKSHQEIEMRCPHQRVECVSLLCRSQSFVFLIIAGSFIPVLASLRSSPRSFGDVFLLRCTQRCTAFVAIARSDIGSTGCGSPRCRCCSLRLRFVAVSIQTPFI